MALMGYIDEWDINGEEYEIHDKGRGQSNGVATLDSNGRIPYSQLPESAIELKGYWDADTNTPELADGTGTNGDEYIVSVAGTQDLGSGEQYFGVGDRVLYTSGIWKNISSGFVRSINTETPDSQGEVSVVVGGNKTPLTSKFLSAVFGTQLGRAWFGVPNLSGMATKIPCYAKNVWVLGITNHRVHYSEDGKTWFPAEGFEYEWSDKAIYGNGVWVCGTNGHGVYYSTDGKHWSLTDLPSNSWAQNCEFHDGIFVNVGPSNVYWSEDGAHWTIGEGISGTGVPIYYKGNLWFCATSSGLYWSENGKSWTLSNITSGSSPKITYGTLYNPSLNRYEPLWVCLMSSSSTVYQSSDGKNWSSISSISPSSNSVLVYGNGAFIISGSSGNWCRKSTSWVSITGIPTNSRLRDISYANGIFIAGAYDSSSNFLDVYYSYTGSSWEVHKGASIASYYGSSYANGVWLIGNRHYSLDGITWADTNLLGPGSSNYATYCGGRWIGSSGGLSYSYSAEELIELGLIDLGENVPLINS